MVSYRATSDAWAVIKKKLKAVPDQLLKDVMKKSLNKNADAIVARAKANAPFASGKLRNSIEAGNLSGKSQAGFWIGAGNREKNGAWYAHLIENGYMAAVRGPGKRIERGSLKGKTRKIKHIPGKHYLSRAVEAQVESALNDLMTDLQDAFE